MPICGTSEPPFNNKINLKLSFSLGHQFLTLSLEAEDGLDLLNKFWFHTFLYDVLIVEREFCISHKISALTCSHFR